MINGYHEGYENRGRGRVILSLCCGTMKWIWALLVFAVVSGCVVIAVTLLELQEPSPISPAMLPVDHNDVAHHGASVNRQRFILVRTVLAHASEPSTFVNPNSPQTAALKWLAYQDQIVDLILPSENATLDVALSVFNESAYRWKLEQRYALMVLSFSTNGEAWRNVVPWAYHVETDECTASFQGVGCDFSSGRVTQVVLSNRLIGGHLPEEIGKALRLAKREEAIVPCLTARIIIPCSSPTQLYLLS